MQNLKKITFIEPDDYVLTTTTKDGHVITIAIAPTIDPGALSIRLANRSRIARTRRITTKELVHA